MEINLRTEILKHLFARYKDFSLPPEDQKKKDEKRSDFVTKFSKNQIQQMKKEDYFAGLGKKRGINKLAIS